MNPLQVIHPYRDHGVMAFDDEQHGLRREPLVLGADEIIDDLVAEHLLPLGLTREQTDQGVTLLFSHQPFPGHQVRLTRVNQESGGIWYAREPDGKRGWLCPALFKYFRQAPGELYARVQARVHAPRPAEPEA